MDVWFTPDNYTVPFQYLGIANESVTECQGLGQTCRGNMWIPPSLNGVCPVSQLKGTNSARFIACYQQQITLTTCQSSAILQDLILPKTGGQTACIRLASRTQYGCGNVGQVLLYWLDITGAVRFPAFVSFVYNVPSGPMDLVGCFDIPPQPSVTPTITASGSITASVTMTATRTASRSTTPSYTASASGTPPPSDSRTPVRHVCLAWICACAWRRAWFFPWTSS